MPIIPAYVQPLAPVPGESAGAQPVLASTPRGLGDRVNALLGWTALRWGTRHVQPGDLATDVPLVGAVSLAPIRWTRSPAASLVWVGVWYTAFEPKGSSPAISVELQYTDAAPIDGPVAWSDDNAQLELTDDHTLDLAAAAGATDALRAEAFFAGTAPPDRFVQTGWSASAAGDEPRLLELPEGEHGEVQLVVAGADVRIYAVVWAEVFRSQT